MVIKRIYDSVNFLVAYEVVLTVEHLLQIIVFLSAAAHFDMYKDSVLVSSTEALFRRNYGVEANGIIAVALCHKYVFLVKLIGFACIHTDKCRLFVNTVVYKPFPYIFTLCLSLFYLAVKLGKVLFSVVVPISF